MDDCFSLKYTCSWRNQHFRHSFVQTSIKQDYIPVGCVPPARWPYLPASSARGGGWSGGCLFGGVPAWSRWGVCSWGVPGLGGLPDPGGVPGPGGRVPGLGGWGACLVPEEMPGPRGVGWYPSMHWGRHPRREQNSWHTLLKILPCPKLRLRAVTTSNIKPSYLLDF